MKTFMANRPQRICGLLAACFVIATGLAAGPFPARAEHGFKDGVYYVSLDVIRQELAETKRFPAASETPNPYLTDFFGLQRIRDVSIETVLADLVPARARVLSRSPVLKLRVPAGFTVAFYVRCPLALDGNFSPDFKPSFIEAIDFSPAFKDRHEALAAFLALLEQAGLTAAYLEPNPYAAFERTAAADLKADDRPRPTGWPQYKPGEREDKKAAAIAGFERAPRGILMFGDTHGSEEDYAAVWGFLNRAPAPAIDWLGLEMLTRDLQPVVDDYLLRADGTAAFKAAEKKLTALFSTGWDKRFENPGAPDEGHYFRLVKWARAHRVKVYALDAVPEYTLFRYGEFPLGATTRNIVWAETVPLLGRGVVYGGSAHFVPLPATPRTFQDYMRRRDPALELFY